MESFKSKGGMEDHVVTCSTSVKRTTVFEMNVGWGESGSNTGKHYPSPEVLDIDNGAKALFGIRGQRVPKETEK